MTRTEAPQREPPLPDDAHPNVRRLIAHNDERCRAVLASGEHVPVQSVGIVGAGLMGTAVAAASLAAGLRVVLSDTDPAARQRAAANVLAQLVAHGREASLADRLLVTAGLDALGPCELVLESVTETTDAKRRVHAALERVLADRAVLGTNTSTIPIGRLSAELRRPERLVGLHFFHPVGQRPLVELVRRAETSAAAIATALGYARAIDKMVLLAADGPGFVVNRLLLPYLTEAVELLTDGVPIERVEAVATAFGMAKGPLRLLDEIGLDTAVAGGRVLWEAFPRRVVISPLLIAMYKAGRFGVKSGAGFFHYDAGESETDEAGPSTGETSVAPDGPPVDSVALEKIAEWTRTRRTLTDEHIRDRLLLPMVLEATRLLEEENVADPRDVDLGVLFGLGFPAARGGLLYWADTLGAAEFGARLEALGPRGEPTALLRQMAERGRTFYDLPVV